MTSELWSAVDDLFARHLGADDPVLAGVVAAAAAAGLPAHHVSPLQGALLGVLARGCGARTILEVGTLAGYSTIWLARALPPGGRVVTIESDPDHAAVAAASFERAGLTDVVELVVGDGLAAMARLEGPFDLVFVDADKAAAADHFDAALGLSRPGTMIVVDNVVRGGAVADAGAGAVADDPSVLGVRRLIERMGAEPRVTATAVQTVGEKGYDGFAIAVVTDGPIGRR